MHQILSITVLLFTGVALGAGRPKPIAIGERIPDAVVHTADAKPLKLREAVKQKPAVLIFYRGEWCPYCTRHLMGLNAIEADVKAAGYQILAISPDQPSKLAETPGGDKLGYRLLSDSLTKAAAAFGITFKVPNELVNKYKSEYQIDIEAASGETHHVLPHPAVFVVDSTGKVRFAYVNQDYKVRLEPEEILAAVREVKGE